jgi:hypothetical protein
VSLKTGHHGVLAGKMARESVTVASSLLQLRLVRLVSAIQPRLHLARSNIVSFPPGQIGVRATSLAMVVNALVTDRSRSCLAMAVSLALFLWIHGRLKAATRMVAIRAAIAR